MTLPRTLVALNLLASLALFGLIVPAAASAQGGSDTLSVRIAALRSDNETIQFCVELGDEQPERVCPQRRRLGFADAPDGRWLTSEWFFIAPETSLRIRARRVGERLEFGLQLSADGTRETLLPLRRFVTWDQTPIGQWRRSSSVTLELPAAVDWELGGHGVAPWAGRLELDAPAPEFRLPQLADGRQLVALSEAQHAGRATLIVFWASWAPLADETLAALQRLADSRSDLQVIGVNVYEQSPAAAQTLAQLLAGSLLHLADADGEVARHYRVDGLPELYLLDSRGVYRAVIRGAAPLEEILAALSVIE